MMLYIFLDNYREALIDRCLIKVARRSGGHTEHALSTAGIPLFLDQVIQTLKLEQSSTPKVAGLVSGPAGGPSKNSGLGKSATKHGRELSDKGFTVEQVVHDYGDLCQAIMDLALELEVPIEVEEFRTLNRCLDNAIADAVTEFSDQRRLINDDREQQALNHRIGTLAHELRAHINAAVHSYAAIKSGQAGMAGATSKVLDRSLKGMRLLVDQTFAEAKTSAKMLVNQEVILIDELLVEIKEAVAFEVEKNCCTFEIFTVGLGLAVEADRELISSAIKNLLQNAFKFTRTGSAVTLTAYAEANKLLLDIQDHCGGLGKIDKEEMFLPFKQAGLGKPGLGLGLSISRRAVEANGGTVSLRDLPGSGCVFTISLPLYASGDNAPLSRSVESEPFESLPIDGTSASG